MGRLLLFSGIIMIIVGFSVPFVGMANLFNALETSPDGTNSRASAYCEEDEHLEQVEGSSFNSSDGLHSTSIDYYCVNDEGVRRDITGEFVGDLFGVNGDSVFSWLTGFVGITVIFICVGTVGIFATIAGALMSKGKRRTGSGTSAISSSMGIASVANQGLSHRLKELEKAYQQNLMSREEYEKARQQILDSMGNE